MEKQNKQQCTAYGTTDGKLKPAGEILLPDPRFQFFAMVSKTGQRPFEQADLHRRLSDTVISPTAPEKVRLQYETARNLMLYCWFVFEFQTVAEMQAYAALELALNEKFGFPKNEVRTKKGKKLVPMMLAVLLQKAAKEKLIIAEKLPAWKRVQSRRNWEQQSLGIKATRELSPKKWLNHVIEILPRWRNGLAHGKSKLYLEASFFQLELCGDLINALFPTDSAQ